MKITKFTRSIVIGINYFYIFNLIYKEFKIFNYFVIKDRWYNTFETITQSSFFIPL